MLELKPCPFCGRKIKAVITDDEGNMHDDDYEKAPWSGLGYQLYHDIADDPSESCPIAGHEGEGVMGVWIYDTKDEAIRNPHIMEDELKKLSFANRIRFLFLRDMKLPKEE